MKRGLIFCTMLLFLGSCAGPTSKVYKAYKRHNIEQLIQYVEDAKEPWLIEDAAKYLQELKATRALPFIRQRLSDQHIHPRARAQLCYTLATLGNDDDVPLLLQSLEQLTSTDERALMAQALSYHCTEESIAALQDLSHDSDVIVSRSAVHKLSLCQKQLPEAQQ